MPEAEVKWKRGELAELSGTKSETLRFYETTGLLMPERGPNGHRLYGSRDLKRVRLIQRATRVGFSLDDLKSWLAADAGRMETSLKQIDVKIGELEKLRKSLKKRLRAVDK